MHPVGVLSVITSLRVVSDTLTMGCNSSDIKFTFIS